MKKRITAILLALYITLGMAAPAFAVNSGEAEQAKDDLLLAQAREYGLLAYKDFADLDATATKLDLAKILIALGKFEVSAPEDGDYIFTDCDDLTEQEKNIVYATIQTGIFSGVGPSQFGPDMPATRAQVVVGICRTERIDYPITPEETTGFEDCAAGMWFTPAISALEKVGIFTIEGNKFSPTDDAKIRDMLRWAVAAHEYKEYGKVGTISITNAQPVSLKEGGNATFGPVELNLTTPAPKYVWTSSNTAVATVTVTDGGTATVSAFKKGTAEITVQLANGNHADCTVTVEEADKATDMTIPENITVAVGATQAISITLTPADAVARYEVVSDNEHILSAYTVSNKMGIEVKGVNPGTATITVTTDNGLIKTALVKVGNDGDAPHDKNVEVPAVAPSCTAVGYTVGYKCSVCGEVVVAPTEIPMLNHHTEIRNAKSPTTTEQGYTGDEVCTVCGTVVKAGTAIPKLSNGGNSGGGDYRPTPPTNSITTPKQDNGSITANTEKAKSGDKVTLTVSPDKGFELSELKITDKAGKTVDYIKNTDGTYTFIMPNSTVEIEAVFTEVKPAIDVVEVFTDVDEKQWYVEAVSYVVNNGLMNGYGNGEFAPENNLSRAMLAQILYNKEGRPFSNRTGTFTDVDSAAWYADAVVWAAENGIAGGYGDGRFGANDSITREQLAVMLWRYAGSPDSTYEIDNFSDSETTSPFAETAIRWAVENGVIHGDGQSLNPGGLATRAQVAQMLMNYFA